MFDSSTFYTSPFSYMDNTLNYVLDDSSLNSKQDDPFYLASSYYHLPSPLIYNEIDSYRDLNSAPITDNSSIFEESNMKIESKKGEETIIETLEKGHEMNKNMERKVRITSKKDRHSKINTAHGLRDRRMRLSLEVAGPLFKLQDMLGFDKASSTIKWLLLKSKDAIDEVFRTKSVEVITKCCSNFSSSISTSDCEVESIFKFFENQGTSKDDTKRRRLDVTSNNSSVVKENKKKSKMIRKTTTKELRNEARARARKRTLEGSMQNSKDHVDGSMVEN